MQRTIVTPAVLPPAALDELKQWLGITTPHDDAPLTALLRTALAMCEAFTGTMPIASEYEELHPVYRDWRDLSTRPVQAITALTAVAADGSRTPLAISAYAIDLDASGAGRFRIVDGGTATRVAVRFSAGLAPVWSALPEPLRHGIVRLAAHQHRERETSGAAPVPPAAIAALWRPWRRLRLT